MLRRTDIFGLLLAAAAGLAVSACGELLGPDPCQPGREVTVDAGRLCIYESPVVIETGFDCPADRPYLFVVGDVSVCTDNPDLPPDALDNLLPLGPPADSGGTPAPVPADPPAGGTSQPPAGSTGSTASGDDSAQAGEGSDEAAAPSDDGEDDGETDDGGGPGASDGSGAPQESDDGEDSATDDL